MARDARRACAARRAGKGKEEDDGRLGRFVLGPGKERAKRAGGVARPTWERGRGSWATGRWAEKGRRGWVSARVEIGEDFPFSEMNLDEFWRNLRRGYGEYLERNF